MKKTLLGLAMLAIVSIGAHSEPTQPSPGQGFPANPRLPWWFNNPSYASQSRFYDNQYAVNPAAADLGRRLADLQNALQQALPALSSFNANLPPANPTPAQPASESAKAAAAGTLPAP